jgi:queuine tRNA-ribosyltransferase
VMLAMVEETAPALPADRPRYLLGVGTPEDLIESVARGIDMFDCVLPTRNARNGQLLTRHGPRNIRNARYTDDPSPVDDACRCYTCLHFSRAYLRHLASTGEMLGATLGSMHNLFFYLDLMEGMRKTIEFGSFEEFRQNFHRTFSRQPLTR